MREKIVETDKKVEPFGQNSKHCVWQTLRPARHLAGFIPMVRHGGGSIVLWRHFSAAGMGKPSLGVSSNVHSKQLLQTSFALGFRLSGKISCIPRDCRGSVQLEGILVIITFHLIVDKVLRRCWSWRKNYYVSFFYIIGTLVRLKNKLIEFD